MRKQYCGLVVMAVNVGVSDSIHATSSKCFSTVTLQMENYICISPVDMRQIEWYGNQE